MKRLIQYIKQIFCDHTYGNGKMNPFTDEKSNRSATYTCTKCGYKIIKTFNKK